MTDFAQGYFHGWSDHKAGRPYGARGRPEPSETSVVFVRCRQSPWMCGKHFCEQCGDCLACYPEDSCYNSKPHHFAAPGADLSFPVDSWKAGPNGPVLR